MCKNCRESFETISYHFNQKLFKYIDTDSSVCQGGALLLLFLNHVLYREASQTIKMQVGQHRAAIYFKQIISAAQNFH